MSDEATVEVAKMVLVGKQNKDIVLRLNRHGQPAVGICGDDGLLFRVRKSRREGPTSASWARSSTWTWTCCNHIAEDYIPVIASVGADAEGNSYNVNADTAAAAIAEAMGAFKVIFLTDVEGWLADPERQRISQATAAEVRERLPRGERRHAPEARGVPARARRRRGERAHRRRPRAALAAARAVHGRGHRDEAVALADAASSRSSSAST